MSLKFLKYFLLEWGAKKKYLSFFLCLYKNKKAEENSGQSVICVIFFIIVKNK